MLQHERGVVGDYHVTFNKRSHYNYQAHTMLKGYFIRKSAWKMIMEDTDHTEVVIEYKQKMTK